MGHVFGPADQEYLKKHPTVYFDNLEPGTRFKMSEVQFYYEGPYDFVNVFVKTPDGAAVYESTGVKFRLENDVGVIVLEPKV